MRARPGFLRHLVPPRSLAVACALPCVLAACGDASFGSGSASGRSEAEVGASVRDSAGVAIVEHGRIDLAEIPEWRLAAEPELDIGRVAGDPRYLLHEVRDAIRRDDGSVVAIVGSEVRAFGPDGTFLWSQGRAGQGPGAYMGPLFLASVRADSIVVWDHALRRFSVLSPDGDFARVVTLNRETYPGMLGVAGPHGLAVRELSSTPQPTRPRERLFVQTQTLTASVVGLDGETTYSWGPVAAYRTYRYSWASSGAPWEGDPSVVAARDGRPGLWLGDGGAPVPELRLLRTGDRMERIVRWEADRTVTEQDREEYRRWYLDDASDIEHRERRRSYQEMLDRLPWPDRFPAYDRIMTDGAGRLWVAEYLREDRVEDEDPQRWTIFSSDGRRVLGWYAAPQRWERVVVKDIGEDWMLVLERDELEVEHLRLYRVEKGRKER